MKRKLICLGLLIFVLSGCNNQSETQETAKREDAKVLVAYFTWGENVDAFDEASIDVDATTSASLTAPGNVAQLTENINARISADTFSIKVKEPYSSNYDDCLERASSEKSEAARPELVGEVENIDQYDVIFLGYPDWWSTAPMPVFSFIDQNDLSEKEIILFCSHGTSGLGRSVQDISDKLPQSSKLNEDVLGVSREDTKQSENAVDEWLEDLGFYKGES